MPTQKELLTKAIEKATKVFEGSQSIKEAKKAREELERKLSQPLSSKVNGSTLPED